MQNSPTTRNDQIRVAVVGATGLAGQQFLAALSGHPRFHVTTLAASTRSAGKSYAEAIRHSTGQLGWYANEPLDPTFADIKITPANDLDLSRIDLVFTAIESEPARELEPKYAAECPVISTASAFRYEDDVPLLLPGINMEQAVLLDRQRERRGWKGFISPNPNCTAVGLAITLAPLHRAFGVRRVHMVSLQAVSGAGRSPGVIALDVVDNVIPFIPKEEEKVAAETRKVLGVLDGDRIAPADVGISVTCTRIGVIEGHTEAVHVELAKDVSADDISAAWREHGADFLAAGYHSAPDRLIHVHDDPFRPQVRLDRDWGNGMTTVVGRLRRDETVPNGWKYVLVSHNTKMGAATGCVLVAEHLVAAGYVKPRR
ncbi:MAG: aspartate-semialdehyde dehydrogenase [Proteobacteria bacterium]|nr:aspartate-semialdehyde dehydrogenase [Pseudomonadota bacterium]